MTATELLAFISAALLLEVTAGLGWAVWRRSGTVAAPPASRAAARGESDAAWAGWRAFRVAQRDFEDAALSQCSFCLQPVDGDPLPEFKPGQFLTFALDVAAPDANGQAATRTVTRCYSLSDRPQATHYRVTIKRVPAPAGHPEFAPGLASNHFLDHVRVGDVVRVKAPAGRFFIDPDPDTPVVLIGAGIGITPMMSMLSWCAARQPQRVVHLYYGLRNGREFAFKPGLEALAASHPALDLHRVYSRPDASDLLGRDYRHDGYVDIELLRRTLPRGRHQFYVCGPPAMMQALVPALAAWGVPGEDIRFEAFGPASVELAGAAQADAAAPVSMGAEVRFRRSGRTLTWDGRDASLLEFAERHGIEVEAGCRSGSCGSCETRLLQGSVGYAHAPDHDLAPGHCLLCVGQPSSSSLALEA